MAELRVPPPVDTDDKGQYAGPDEPIVQKPIDRTAGEGEESDGPELPPGMMEGVVRRFDAHKGHGFIETRDSREEITVHRKDFNDEGLSALHPGDVVAFKLGRNKFGRRAALRVQVIGWEAEEDPDAAPREWTF